MNGGDRQLGGMDELVLNPTISINGKARGLLRPQPGERTDPTFCERMSRSQPLSKDVGPKEGEAYLC